MFKKILRPYIVRSLSSICNKSYLDNNKTIEDLIKQQNCNLEYIKKSLSILNINISLLTVVIIIKPMY